MDNILMEVGGAIIAATSSIISGIILYKYQKQQKLTQEKDKQKSEYEYSCMQTLNALCTMCKELYVVSMLGRTPNGELAEAFEYMQKCKHEHEDYLRKLASKK